MISLIFFLGLIQGIDVGTQPAVLSGTVKNKDGQPIPGASVFIRMAGPRTGVGRLCPYCYPDCGSRALTDKQGAFVLKNLDPALVFRLLLVAEGYAPLLPDTVDPRKGPTAIVMDRHDLENRAPGLVLRGRVLYRGNPVKNATVRPFGMKTEKGGVFGAIDRLADPLAITNERGEFRLGVNNKDGSYFLEVEAPLLAPTRVGPLPAGATVHEVKMVAGVTVKGKVVRDGKPASAITLMLCTGRIGKADMFSEKIATDADGVFQFMNVPPDREYHLFGMMRTCAPFVIDDRPVRVGASGATMNVGEIVMQPGHRVEGRLVLSDDKAVPADTRAILTLFRKGVIFADSADIDVALDGGIKFAGLPAGRYSLRVQAKGYLLSPKNFSFVPYPRLSMSQLTGRVDGDILGLRILLEPDSEPAAAQPNARDRIRRSEEPLRGVLAQGVKETPKAPLFPVRGDKENALEALREAANAVEKISGPPSEKITLWRVVANRFHLLGDDKSARTCADRAVETIDKYRLIVLPDSAEELGAVYARLGDMEAARKLIAKSKPQNAKRNIEQNIFQTLALDAAEAGNKREAEKLANALSDAETKKSVKETIRRYVLLYKVKAGDAAGAIQAALESPVAKEKISLLVGKDFVNLSYDDPSNFITATNFITPRTGIAQVQLAMGDKTGATKSASRALELLAQVDSGKAPAALAIVQVFARVNDLAAVRKALAIVAEDKRPGPALKAKGYLAAALVRTGQDNDALALVADFEEPAQRAYILHWIALAQARAGKKEAARANFDKATELIMAEPAKKGGAKMAALHNLACALALAGDFTAAHKVIEGPQSPVGRRVIISMQAESGDFEGARKAAATDANEKDKFGRNRYAMLSNSQNISRIQAKAGQIAAVRDWAQKANDPVLSARILVGAAEGLAMRVELTSPKR